MKTYSRYGAVPALALASVIVSGSSAAAAGRITVKVDQPGVKISPMLYGLMTEEINHSYDGGLYAELIQNRALKDDDTQPVHWSVVADSDAAGTIALDTDNPVNSNLSKSLRLDITAADGGKRVGVANDGYWGIPVRPNTVYKASFYARASAGFEGALTISIESADGSATLCKAQVAKVEQGWKQYTVSLKTGAIAPSQVNHFVISAKSPGTLWLSQISLFPPTYKNRPNGNRVDLMEKLAALKPALLRFPGGNYLEGDTIETRFNWKNTLGPLENRPGHMGCWNYRSSEGLGMMEFLNWCDDLKMEPLLAVYAGYSLNHYQNPNPQRVEPGPALQPFVQDALDEIEFMTGDKTTKWGAMRAKLGHPAPYTLHYVEIGNEDWFDNSGSYDGRFAQFYDAIKAKYPKLQLIATTGVRSRTPDMYDEHYYRSARDMEKNAGQYDNYNRSRPKVFVGEWASQEGNPTPNMNSALGDAAWMVGLERNADVVTLSTYAPLLVNVNPGAAQWGTNLIGYDALNSFASPSYYVQTMFGNNLGDVLLPVTLDIPEPPQVVNQHPKGKVGVATWGTHAEFKDISVTHAGQTLYKTDFAAGDADWKKGEGSWKVVDGALQQSGDLENSRATAGSDDWTDYTYHVKARKISGNEGFLILFHHIDDANWAWLNVGGWGNSRTVIERSFDGAKSEIGPSVPLKVETGRWYDIRIEVEGPKVRCYVDDKLIIETTDAAPPPPASVYSTASRDLKTGDVILKVVNIAAVPQDVTLDLAGAGNIASRAAVSVVEGNPTDVNSLAEPEKITAKQKTITVPGKTFAHSFPPHSVTVLRVGVK